MSGLQITVDGVTQLQVDQGGMSASVPLALPRNPTKPMEAATKQYVDLKFGNGGGGAGGGSASEITLTPGGGISSTNVQAAIAELDAEKVAMAGDTMSGALILSGDPANALGAATKQYVDAHAGSGSTDWNDITNKPVSFPPSSHSHAISDVVGLQAALDSKISEAPQDGRSYGRRSAAWDWVVSHNADIVDGGNF
jgi:hypothetical protein